MAHGMSFIQFRHGGADFTELPLFLLDIRGDGFGG